MIYSLRIKLSPSSKLIDVSVGLCRRQVHMTSLLFVRAWQCNSVLTLAPPLPLGQQVTQDNGGKETSFVVTWMVPTTAVKFAKDYDSFRRKIKEVCSYELMLGY